MTKKKFIYGYKSIFFFLLLFHLACGESKSEKIIINDSEPIHINHDFFEDELKLCDIFLIAKRGNKKNNNSLFVVEEILRDKTNTIKKLDVLSPYSYRGIRKENDNHALFCRRYNHDFINFFNKKEHIATNNGLISIDKIRMLFSGFLEIPSPPDNNFRFKIKTPYHINRTYFIEEKTACDILLISKLSKKSDEMVLSISEIIYDKTNSIAVGDLLTTVPFHDILNQKHIGALFCRRGNLDFLNFFDIAKLTEPDKIPIAEIKKEYKKNSKIYHDNNN